MTPGPRPSAMLVAATASVVAGPGACALTDLDRVGFRCDSANLCPAGQVCLDGFCGTCEPGECPGDEKEETAMERRLIEASSFGGVLDDEGRAIVVHPTGDLVIGGEFSGEVDFGAGPHVGAGYADAFVIRHQQEGGLSWSRSFGGPGQDRVAGLAVAPDGEIVAAGSLRGISQPGGKQLQGSRASLTMIDADGEVGWQRPFVTHWADGAIQPYRRVAGFAVAASVSAAQAFEWSPEPSGGEHLAVARLDEDGRPVWVRSFAGCSRCDPQVGVDALDNVYVGAPLWEVLIVNGITLSSRAATDALVMSLDPQGAVRWARTVDGAGAAMQFGIAADPAGGAVVLLGGDGHIQASGSGDQSPVSVGPVVVRLDEDGHEIWRTPTGFEITGAVAILVGPAGEVFIGGSRGSSMVVERGPSRLLSLFWAGYVLALDPTGEVAWEATTTGPGDAAIAGLALAPDGVLHAVGRFEREVGVGGTTLRSQGGSDVLLLSLQP